MSSPLTLMTLAIPISTWSGTSISSVGPAFTPRLNPILLCPDTGLNPWLRAPTLDLNAGDLGFCVLMAGSFSVPTTTCLASSRNDASIPVFVLLLSPPGVAATVDMIAIAPTHGRRAGSREAGRDVLVEPLYSRGIRSRAKVFCILTLINHALPCQACVQHSPHPPTQPQPHTTDFLYSGRSTKVPHRRCVDRHRLKPHYERTPFEMAGVERSGDKRVHGSVPFGGGSIAAGGNSPKRLRVDEEEGRGRGDNVRGGGGGGGGGGGSTASGRGKSGKDGEGESVEQNVESRVDRIAEVLLRVQLLVAMDRGRDDAAQRRIIELETLLAVQEEENLSLKEKVAELERQAADQAMSSQPTQARASQQQQDRGGAGAGSGGADAAPGLTALLNPSHGQEYINLDSDEEVQTPSPGSNSRAAQPQSNQQQQEQQQQQQQQQQRQSNQRSGAEGEDDDVMFVGSDAMLGGDLPHPRHICPTNTFDEAGSETNSQACERCYCYVCDIQGSELRV